MSVSRSADALQKLSGLSESDPDSFKKLAHDIASTLNGAAATQYGASASMLSGLAQSFTQASESGDASGIQMPDLSQFGPRRFSGWPPPPGGTSSSGTSGTSGTSGSTSSSGTSGTTSSSSSTDASSGTTDSSSTGAAATDPTADASAPPALSDEDSMAFSSLMHDAAAKISAATGTQEGDFSKWLSNVADSIDAAGSTGSLPAWPDGDPTQPVASSSTSSSSSTTSSTDASSDTPIYRQDAVAKFGQLMQDAANTILQAKGIQGDSAVGKWLGGLVERLQTAAKTGALPTTPAAPADGSTTSSSSSSSSSTSGATDPSATTTDPTGSGTSATGSSDPSSSVSSTDSTTSSSSSTSSTSSSSSSTTSSSTSSGSGVSSSPRPSLRPWEVLRSSPPPRGFYPGGYAMQRFGQFRADAVQNVMSTVFSMIDAASSQSAQASQSSSSSSGT